MKNKDVLKLENGLYEIHWKASSGTLGISLASVGSFDNGDKWMAPCSWINLPDRGASMMRHWKDVERVQLIK